MRQNGKELFTPDAWLRAADAQAWFDLMVKAQKAKAIGTPQQISEESPKPLDQSAITVGTAAMQLSNSNQLEAFTAAAGKELTILRLPSLTGNAAERKAWYKASQLFSASARTKNPEAAVKFINWLVNSPESANINLAERGIPANTEMLARSSPSCRKRSRRSRSTSPTSSRSSPRRRAPRRPVVARSPWFWCATPPMCCSAGQPPLMRAPSSWRSSSQT